MSDYEIIVVDSMTASSYYRDQLPVMPQPTNFYQPGATSKPANNELRELWDQMEQAATECDKLVDEINVRKKERTWSGFFATLFEGRSGLWKCIHEIFKNNFPSYRMQNKERNVLNSQIQMLKTTLHKEEAEFLNLKTDWDKK